MIIKIWLIGGVSTNKNKYKIVDDYVIGYTKRGNEFYFDIDDYEIIRQYYWKLDSSKNVICMLDDGSQLSMHKLLMGDGIYVHKNELNNDNRRSNLVSIRGYKNNGKTYLNGYIAIYFPEHPRAFGNGCVYEHLLVAEKILNRNLTKDECVHHIDLNRTNNDVDNLMIFATEKDHIAFHNGMGAILQDNGTYVCNDKDKIEYYDYLNRTKKEIDENIIDIGSVVINKNGRLYNLCPICKCNIKTLSAKMCQKCHFNDRAKNIPDKNVLEKLIKEKSMVEIGKQYGVSDNAVRRWCIKYGLPYRRKDIIGIKIAWL